MACFAISLFRLRFSWFVSISAHKSGSCHTGNCKSAFISAHKTAHGWRYSTLGIGRRPEAAKNGPFFIRVRDGANKYKWQRHDTESAARKAAERAPLARKAQELGLLPDEVTNETNKDRVPIKTAVESYLNERRFGRPRSIEVYENVFNQLLENLPAGIKFITRPFVQGRARPCNSSKKCSML